jgi:apolipoprotein N-acyltransferase
MRRWLPGLSIAALVAIPAALSFAPGFPTHGYGHVLLLYPLVPALLHPERRRRLALYVAGLVLQFLAFPDPDLGFLGWVLLWPYLLAREREDGAPWRRSAFLYGFLRAFAGFYWIGNVHYTGWLGVSLASGFAFVVAFEWPLRRLTFVPYALRVAACWLLFEGLHSWLLGGLPWLLLAHTQYRFLALVQMADLVGAFGVSFVVALVQAAALEAIRARRLTASAGAAAALLVAALLYGAMRRGPRGPEGPGVLMVQTAVPSYVKEHEEARPSLWGPPMRLTKEGLASHPGTALVVWPETMFPVDYVEWDREDGEPAEAETVRARFRARLRDFTRVFGKPAVFGLASFPDVAHAERARGYNAAILVDAKGEPARDPRTGRALLYRKQRLVPMSEEFLLRRVLPESWCDSIFDSLCRNFGLPRSSDLLAGAGFVTLDAGPGLRCAVLICFEGLYPSLARGAVEHEDPDLLLHLVNNGWFLSPRFLGGACGPSSSASASRAGSSARSRRARRFSRARTRGSRAPSRRMDGSSAGWTA